MNIPQRIVIVVAPVLASLVVLSDGRVPEVVALPICILVVGAALVVALKPRRARDADAGTGSTRR